MTFFYCFLAVSQSVFPGLEIITVDPNAIYSSDDDDDVYVEEHIVHVDNDSDGMY